MIQKVLITEEAAAIVNKLQEQYGKNELVPQKKESFVKKVYRKKIENDVK